MACKNDRAILVVSFGTSYNDNRSKTIGAIERAICEAYGDSWEYNYEDFVAYDAKNRKTASGAPARARRNYVERPMEPTHAPVVVPRRWNDPVPAGKKYSPASVTPRRPAPDTFGPETERRYCTKDFQ